MKLKTSFKLGNTTVMFTFHSMPTPKEPTIGIASRVPKTLCHVIFLDYDYISWDILTDELKALQETFLLSDFHVFKMDREDAYHCICLDMLPLYEVRQVIMSSSCDLAFKLAPRFNEMRSWVLRTYPKGKRDKPSYFAKVKSTNNVYLQSKAHAKYLNLHYGCDIKLVNPSGNEELLMVTYLTAKRVR